MAIAGASFGLLIIAVILLTCIMLFLHYTSSRYGISLVLMYIATIVGILTYADPLTIFLEPVSDIILTIPGDIFVPTVIGTILVLYIMDGTEITQVVIFGISLIQLLVSIVFTIITQAVHLPTATTLINSIQFTDVLGINLQIMIAGVIAFVCDMFVVAFVYQGVTNVVQKSHTWLAVGIALLGASWTDAIIFNFLASVGNNGFTELIPGDIVSKSITALTLLPLIAVYLHYFAPRLPSNKNTYYRSTFDIFHNLFGNWQFKVIRLEAELREAEINTKQLIHNIDEIFWIAEQGEQQSYFISPAFEKLLGIPRGEYYLNPEIIYEQIHPDDLPTVKNHWLCYSDKNDELIFRVIKSDGDVRWLRDRSYRLQDETLNIDRTIGITADITSQKEREALEMAIHIEREKLMLLYNLIGEVAHDLQSPITALSLKVGLLQQVKGDKQREEKYLQELQKQTAHLSELVEHLFTLIKIESQIDVVDEITSFNEVCQDVFDELYPSANEHNITLQLTLADSLSSIRGTRSELYRVVHNLVSNAIRYSKIKGTVHIVTKVDTTSITLTVRDTGIGISEHDLPFVFDRFYRASNSHGIQGTGLGLSITKQIVNRAGGTISVESTLDIGTTFSVSLPLVTGQE